MPSSSLDRFENIVCELTELMIQAITNELDGMVGEGEMDTTSCLVLVSRLRKACLAERDTITESIRCQIEGIRI